MRARVDTTELCLVSNIASWVTCESGINKACILIVMRYNGYKLSNQRNETKASQGAIGTNMRLIEQQMNVAINDKVMWSKDNTEVTYYTSHNLSHIRLHGHHIAVYDHAKLELIPNLDTLAAWPTVTTKSRLRALGVNVYTRKGITYANDKEVA